MIRITATLALLISLSLRAQGSGDLIQRAKGGDPEAQYQVADSFVSDEKTYDQKLAIEWFRKAAKQGHVKSQIRLVHLLSSGSLALTNYPEAFEWAKKAAESNDPDGTFWLAYCYGFGVSVNRDPKKALDLYRVAAEKGSAKNKYELARNLFFGEEVYQDRSEAMKWYKAAAEQGHPDAMVIFGVAMIEGKLVPKDAQKGFELFEKGKQLGSKYAEMLQAAVDTLRSEKHP
jgi:TPR repeat protein